MSPRIRFLLLPLLALSILAGCAGRQAPAARAPATAESPEASQAPSAALPPASGETVPDGSAGGSPPAALYLSLVEGLHVTGTPVAVDVQSFRLHVRGLVDCPLELSLEEIRAMPAVKEEFQLVCPGFFVDRGVWTGVPLRDILARAGVRPGAANVAFTSLSQGYYSALPLQDAERDGVLVAYEFNGKPLAVVHGYPLRLAAKDHQGSVWVKWLGDIQVLD